MAATATERLRRCFSFFLSLSLSLSILSRIAGLNERNGAKLGDIMSNLCEKHGAKWVEAGSRARSPLLLTSNHSPSLRQSWVVLPSLPFLQDKSISFCGRLIVLSDFVQSSMRGPSFQIMRWGPTLWRGARGRSSSLVWVRGKSRREWRNGRTLSEMPSVAIIQDMQEKPVPWFCPPKIEQIRCLNLYIRDIFT